MDGLQVSVAVTVTSAPVEPTAVSCPSAVMLPAAGGNADQVTVDAGGGPLVPSVKPHETVQVSVSPAGSIGIWPLATGVPQVTVHPEHAAGPTVSEAVPNTV